MLKDLLRNFYNKLIRVKRKLIKSNKTNYLQFLKQSYQLHNIARLSHLESLGLDLKNKNVIEFGAGIGDHSLFYLHKGCEVLPTDARQELLAVIKKRFSIDGLSIDIENEIEKMEKLRGYDIVHAYGILYHLCNPEEFLNAVAKVGDILLLETCVSPDHEVLGPHLLYENKNDPTQAVSGTGCRPSRKWVDSILRDNYNFVYYPNTQPDHPEFPLDWTNLSGDSLVRCIFIASNIELKNPRLNTSMPTIYSKQK